jgi:hypothetical protein
MEEAVNWALNGGPDPDITIHLRMRASRYYYSLSSSVVGIGKLQKIIRSWHEFFFL